MKKQTIALIATCALLQIGSVSFADNMPYEPVFESVPITESITTAVKEQPAKSTISEVPKISAVQTKAH